MKHTHARTHARTPYQMTEEESKLNAYIEKLEGRIKSHKQEIDERDKTIGEKEKQVGSKHPRTSRVIYGLCLSRN